MAHDSILLCQQNLTTCSHKNGCGHHYFFVILHMLFILLTYCNALSPFPLLWYSSQLAQDSKLRSLKLMQIVCMTLPYKKVLISTFCGITFLLVHHATQSSHPSSTALTIKELRSHTSYPPANPMAIWRSQSCLGWLFFRQQCCGCCCCLCTGALFMLWTEWQLPQFRFNIHYSCNSKVPTAVGQADRNCFHYWLRQSPRKRSKNSSSNCIYSRLT